MNNNLASITVICYNNLQYIYQCLDSILEQSYPNIEIVISDDHSENFEGEKIREYIDKNNKGNISNCIINQNNENFGLTKNLNEAIKLTNGDYIITISGDDLFYSSETIRTIVNFHDNHPEYPVAVGYICYFRDNPNDFFWYTPNPNSIPLINGEAIDCFKTLLRYQGSFFPSPGVSHKRSAIEKYGLYNEEYRSIEDLPRFLYLTRNGCRIGFINCPIVKYRSDVGFSTNTQNPAHSSFLECLELIKSKEIYPYLYLLDDSEN